ncbi:MAG: PepSY domain-containing protein [Clostridia bacterium]|nr:PepSY domain-containing protein [Clostridia bacterium]
MKKLWIPLLAAALVLLAGCERKENNAVGALSENAGAYSRSARQVETPATSAVTLDKALRTALTHAGVTRENAYKIEYELDRDDLFPHYDISFKVGNFTYEYEIHAETGAILEREKERVQATLSRDDAKEIAFAHAGVQEQNLRQVEIELDTENGAAVYEVTFRSGSYEYEYEIHADTGAILKFQRER